jgi:transcriptional regulator with XRE-family HTH domain
MKPKSLGDQIRAAIDASGMSRNAVCKATGIDPGSMSRFMSGRVGLSLETLDRLAELLGLRVVAGPKKRQ